MTEIYLEGINDNIEGKAIPSEDKKIAYLNRYHAPTRCAELVCLGCGWNDVYVYFVRIGTMPLTCNQCKNNNCLVEK